MPENPRISVVVPVHNEEDNVEDLTRRLREALPDSYEIIFIDDRSSDSTWARLQALRPQGGVRLIRFRKQFGKTAALMAGFAGSRGQIVFTMDGDLQDDPAEIPRFLAKLDEGYDLVTGWKKTRHDPLTKVVASRIFNAVVRLTTGVALHDVNCGFKVFRAEVVRSLRIYGEQHRFIPVLAAARGFRVGEIDVQHHRRRHGRSKYGFSRLFKGFFDLVTVLLLTRFVERPSHAFGFAAMASFIAALLIASAGFLQGVPPAAGLWAAVGVLAAIVFLAAGWVAEIAVSQGYGSASLPLYSIEEQLD